MKTYFHISYVTSIHNTSKDVEICKEQNKIQNFYFIYFVDIPDYERSDNACLVCSKADTILEAKLSFTCDDEPFRLCGTINIFC